MSAHGELRIIDIRPVEERMREGWPVNATPVPFPMVAFADHSEFVNRVTDAVEGDRSRPLALLCRRGVMSRRAQAVLAEAGFRNVFNISDGFLGSERGPGWKEWGLPMEPQR